MRTFTSLPASCEPVGELTEVAMCATSASRVGMVGKELVWSGILGRRSIMCRGENI